MRFITTCLASSLVLACSTETPNEPVKKNASVRALHMAEGVGDVDLFVDEAETPAFRNLAFGDASPYLDASAGRSVIDVASAGLRVSSIELNLEEGRTYTAVLRTDDILTFRDEPGKMRLVNMADGLGTIDVWDLDRGTLVADELRLGDATNLDPTLSIGIDIDDDASPDMIFSAPQDAEIVDMVLVDDEERTTMRSFFSDGREEDVEMEEPTPPEPAEPARLRVLHLSPDAPNVDVLSGGVRVIENLAFPRSTAFLELPADDYTFDVTATGAIDAVLSVDLSVESGAAYTAVAFGPLAEIGALALEENLEGPASGIRIRVIHAAFGVGQVDVLANDQLLLDDVDFGVASGQIEAPAGTHTVGLDLDDDGTPELTFDLPELIEGASANIFAVADDTGAYLVVQLLDGTTIRIAPRHVEPQPEPDPISFARVLHLSPDAPPVNAFVDAIEAVTGLTFKNGTAYLEVISGLRRLDVSAGALEEAVITLEDVELVEDFSYTIAAFDTVANITPLLLIDDRTSPAAGNIRIRAVHTAVGVGTVNILAGTTVLYEGLEFGTAGDAIEVPAAAYEIGLDVDHDHHPDITFSVPELAEGTIANVFALTDAHGNPSLLAQLEDGTTVDIPANH